MNSKQVQYLVVGVIAVIIMSTAAYFFAIKPQMANASTFKSETEAAEASTLALGAEAADLERKESELDSTTQQYEALAQQFPASFQLRNWIRQVVDTAEASNVKLGALDSSLPTVGDPAAAAAAAATGVPAAPAAGATGEIDPATGQPVAGAESTATLAYSSVTLSAEGSPEELRAFLRALMNMERPLLVDSAEYSATPAEGGGTGSSLNVVGKTFLLKELTNPADVATEEAAADPAAVPTE